MRADIRWVRGNDVLMKVKVKERGNVVDIDSLDSWLVTVMPLDRPFIHMHPEAYTGEDEGVVVVHIPGNYPCGTYCIEFTARKNGNAIRAFEQSMFGIVERNSKANITFDTIEGERSCDVNLEVQLVTEAVVRGENAYEMWKRLAGNEGKSLQDYINEVLHLNELTEEVGRVIAIGTHPDYIGEDNYIYHWEDDQYVRTDLTARGVGIKSIRYKATDTLGGNVYTITLTDDTTYDFTAPRGGGVIISNDDGGFTR